MTLYFPQAVGQWAELNVAVQRIRDYLLSEEYDVTLKSSALTKEAKRVTIIGKDLFIKMYELKIMLLQ